jgi:hypothetical protein
MISHVLIFNIFPLPKLPSNYTTFFTKLLFKSPQELCEQKQIQNP